MTSRGVVSGGFALWPGGRRWRRHATTSAAPALTSQTLPDASAPLVIAGHQPELYHPGVWVKNFATAAIAQARGGVGLNLIVDNDLAKFPAIRVPRLHDGGIHIQRVAYDEWGGDVPYEDLDVRNESFFATFDDRVRRMLAGAVADPMIEDYWPLVLRHREGDPRLGLRLARARRELEASWGVRNFEIPVGDLCENEAFLWFVSHLLAQLPRFQKVHNDALSRYRALYGIRSKNHPVAALRRQGDWREAPFWVWRAEAPRRRPLWVRQLARTMELRIGGDGEPLMEIPLEPDREGCCAVEQLLTLPARRIRLRTRALTTTMFARLLLGDLFFHGIGGAKYDELGDEIVREFFGIEPPDFLTLSITLWLDLGIDPGDPRAAPCGGARAAGPDVQSRPPLARSRGTGGPRVGRGQATCDRRAGRHASRAASASRHDPALQ